MGDASGSDKHYSFRLEGSNNSEVHLYAMMFILNCIAAMSATVERKLASTKAGCKYRYHTIKRLRLLHKALKKQISLTVSLMQLSATCLSEISKSLIKGTISTSS